ncbi:MAG: hypothetical protein K2X93_19155 [Candidatus Obscuribacterales bacterium]|nr:hypothetical protein [Candidatus Obscuribacterales bacterium]
MKTLRRLSMLRRRTAFIASMTATVAAGFFSLPHASAQQARPEFQQPVYQQQNQQPGFNVPEPVQRLMNGQGQPPGGAQAPMVAPPISFVDVNSGKFGKLEIDLEAAQFLDASVDNLHLIARNMDLREGLLNSLDIAVTGGHMQDFIFDKLTLTTQGSMRFDAGVLFNQKILQFTQPTQADVTCEISQESLNKFVNAPDTLDRLSATAVKKAGMLAGLFGGNAPSIGVTVSNGQVVLGKSNRVNIKFDAKVGVGEMAVPMPIEVQSVLGLSNGWVEATDTKLMTAGQEISPAISQWLVKKVNGLSSWGTKSDDIHFQFTDIKVKPGKGFVLRGTAQVNRLRFARH